MLMVREMAMALPNGTESVVMMPSKKRSRKQPAARGQRR